MTKTAKSPSVRVFRKKPVLIRTSGGKQFAYVKSGYVKPGISDVYRNEKGSLDISFVMGFIKSTPAIEVIKRSETVIEIHKRPTTTTLVAAAQEVERSPIDELLEQRGGCLPSALFAKKLKISNTALQEWREQKRVLATKLSKPGYLFPVWQLDSDGLLLPNLNAVLTHLHDAGLTDRGMMRWLLRANANLDAKVPIDLMASNRSSDVVEAARILAAVRQ